jgi:putative stress-induced transcription regulator/CGNR zinc finger protein
MPRWEWLGEPLALDFANTVRRRGMTYEEHLGDEADFAEWARHVGVEPEGDLDEIRALRDAVFALLRAKTRGEGGEAEAGRDEAGGGEAGPDEAGGGEAGGDGGRVVDATLATLTPRLVGGRLVLTGRNATVARIMTSLLEHLDDPRLAFCDAPGCGQFYLRHRGDQRWCGPACGTRARVARHAARGRR